ncbi:MAG: NAD(+)/NADH kinase, partial [Deltaproteobacteria bacterium]|nr:NAD(+)/NADH kinase [Deltaproteobacteria bacterium]
GINYGTVGFLTSGDRSELESILTRLLEGRYVLSERVMLSCRRGEKVYHAVNEVVLRTSFRMAHIEVFLDETKIRTIRGDGVIVGTPTGSTGYLLSTGGPIVMPGADCFVMDGINEYNYTSRSIVVHTGVKIRLQMGDLQTHQKSHMFIDGTEICEIGPGENVYLEKSPRKARLLFFEENHFFHNLSSRLSWQ